MANTANRNYPKPEAEHFVSADVEVLQIAYDMIDADIQAILLSLAGKASSVHGHGISDITGLSGALNGKAALTHTHALDDLSDVDLAGAADGMVLVKTAVGWVPQSAAAAIGAHTHAITDVTNLQAALDAKADAAATATALASKASTAYVDSGLAGKASTSYVDSAISTAISALRAGVSAAYDTLAELASGITDLITRVTALEAVTPAFTKSYTSGELAISNAGSGTLTHGLGATPKLVQVRLVCKTAELNYSVGDEIVWGNFFQAFDKGVSLVVGSTSIFYRYAGVSQPFSLIDKTSGSSNALTNANWRVVVRAWA